LGEDRLLWEVGDCADIRDLRARLDLDSGYLSRLLRSLQAAGLVTVGPGDDRRVRVARLTARGRRERALLDRRSDELAGSLLAPLSDRQCTQLVEAMGTVERLLTAGMVEVTEVDPASPAGRHCLAAYFAELDRRFDGGFDPGASISASDDELRRPHGLLLVATLRHRPVACGALKFHRRGPTELKRMWVDESVRGLGLGRRMLTELESRARGTLRLETNGSLTEAIALYRSSGWTEVPAFNDEPYAHHWFEKRLPQRRRS
jgi:DNA-binding MarR family transcriptional regulator/GNAT superfamily N-acetyltransferase